MEIDVALRKGDGYDVVCCRRDSKRVVGARTRVARASAIVYLKSPLMLVETTGLDALHSVIWNIGALAASGHPYVST